MHITPIDISLHELIIAIGISTYLISRYYLTLTVIHSYIDIPSPGALSFTLTLIPPPTLTIVFSLNVCGTFSISPHRRRSARPNRVHACFSTGPYGRNFRQGIRKIHDTTSDPPRFHNACIGGRQAIDASRFPFPRTYRFMKKCDFAWDVYKKWEVGDVSSTS